MVQKNYDAERRLIEFFIKGLRVKRVSVAKSFGLAGERHCKRGIFPVELPSGSQSVLLT